MKLLLNAIRNSKDCIVLPPSGQPKIGMSHLLPKDLAEFYRECGGVKFFVGSEYPIEILPADEVKLSNPLILPEGWEADIPVDDISNGWYIIAQAGPEQKISIDFDSQRIGKCYDSFWDIHASPGESPVIANSFTELLQNIFKSQGGYWYWLEGDFISLGDAYD